MKVNNFTQKVVKVYHRAAFKVQKHSPEILLVTGVVGVIASAVVACRATTKLSAILEETRENVEAIHDAKESGRFEDRYTEEDMKKDITIVYAKSVVSVAKLYAPAVVFGTLSIGCILASNDILKKRNIALGAAYATIDKCFKEYRQRVVERFGAEADRELRYNIKPRTSETESNNETPDAMKNDFVVRPCDISGYARFFEAYTEDERGNVIPNQNWSNNNEYNILFLKQQERYLNDRLVAVGRVFLNEAYTAVGLPRTKAGQVVGWVYDPENGVGDNYIDFGLYRDNLSYSDFVNGHDNAILLDFNVDGNILDLMK